MNTPYQDISSSTPSHRAVATKSGLMKWGMIILVCLLLLLAMSFWDRSLFVLLHGWGDHSWQDFMSRSMFEGKTFGASDLPTLLQMTCLLTWLIGAWSLRKRAPAWMIKLGFLNISSLWLATFVHLLKGASQRPRPYQLLREGLPFHHFYELDSWHFQGWGHGSFPSGHTASMMSLIAFVYLLPTSLQRWTLSLLVLISAFIMALARIAVGAHWPTDTCASIFLSCVLCELLYRHILKVPVQLAAVKNTAVYPRTLLFWELKLFGYIFGLSLLPLLPLLLWNQTQNIFVFFTTIVIGLVLFYVILTRLGTFQRSSIQKLGSLEA